MEYGLCQTDAQIVAGHLILLRVGGNNGQELEQYIEYLPILIGQQQHGALHRIQTHLGGKICNGREDTGCRAGVWLEYS